MMESSFNIQIKEHIRSFIHESMLLWFSYGCPSPKLVTNCNVERNRTCVFSEYKIEASDGPFAAYSLFFIYSMRTIKVVFKSAVFHFIIFKNDNKKIKIWWIV